MTGGMHPTTVQPVLPDATHRAWGVRRVRGVEFTVASRVVGQVLPARACRVEVHRQRTGARR
jgi:hypothetical protein